MATGFLVVIIVLAGLVVLARVMRLEDAFIYFPDHETYMTPADLGLAYEEVRFGEEGRLHGWFIPGRTDVTILWFHGNASNLSHPGRVEFIKLMVDRLGVGFFIFDYRGYGQSAGKPSEEGLYQDARDALAYLRSRDDVNPERIVYYGRSLGGAVASHLATEDAPYRLILESSFTSTPDMARVQFPFLPLGPCSTRAIATASTSPPSTRPCSSSTATATAPSRHNTPTNSTPSPTSPSNSISSAAQTTTMFITPAANPIWKCLRGFLICR